MKLTRITSGIRTAAGYLPLQQLVVLLGILVGFLVGILVGFLGERRCRDVDRRVDCQSKLKPIRE